MEKIIKKIFVIIFLIILVFFLVFTLPNNKKYSMVERRSLTTFPKFNISNIISKDYYDKLTNAFNDQLALRKYLVKGYFFLNFQRYFGDAVIGKNNQLYSPSEIRPNEKYYDELKDTIKLVNKEAKEINAKFIYLSIPRKDAYMTSDLPKNYNSSLDIYKKQAEITKKNLNNSIIFIDAMEVFKKNNMYYCYYSNDHHVTPRCAYLLVKEINDNLGIVTYSFDNTFEVGRVIVNGAYSRQLGQTVKSRMEDLYVVPKININYTRYENNRKSNKVVFGKGNSYEEAYMEGDNAYTRVITNNPNDEKILYVGSSYTNILEALSVPSYEVVSSIDYRHNKSNKKINDYVLENNIDYVVFIPAQSNNSYSIQQIKLHLGIK